MDIYTKLINGYLVNKKEEALKYGVNERSIQRDIDDIRNYLENNAMDIEFRKFTDFNRGTPVYNFYK